MPNYFDPHLYINIQAKNIVEEGANPPQVQGQHNFGRAYNLGLYTMGELEDLQDKLENRVEAWVADHPPHGNGE